jgi:hypothetical protein
VPGQQVVGHRGNPSAAFVDTARSHRRPMRTTVSV